MSRNDPVSEAQIKYLRGIYSDKELYNYMKSMKIESIDKMTKGQASILIGARSKNNVF